MIMLLTTLCVSPVRMCDKMFIADKCEVALKPALFFVCECNAKKELAISKHVATS